MSALPPQWWSWILTAIGVFGIYLTTRRSWWGYVVGLAAQTLWIAYAVTTRQWGFIVSAAAYGSVYALGWYRWTRPNPPVGRDGA